MGDVRPRRWHDGAVTPPPPSPDELAALILRLLNARAVDRTICPSDVARASGRGDGWRGLMDPVRDSARRLALDGRLRILQRGTELDPRLPWRGPVRLARGPRFGR
jgi:hypothetical protein